MQRRERLILAALAIASLALRALAFLRYRFDSDEAQHLHVAWGWTAGLVQYRDLFDNHAPLFHIVTAPILKAFGERDDILLWMRAPMLILFAIIVWATFVLGRRMYSTRVGVWSAVLLTLLPPFFFKSLEYRTDNLWNAFWFLALVAMTGGQYFLTGFLLGCALATSLKTTLLLLTLIAGAGITRVAFGKKSGGMAAALQIAAGIPIVPAILLAYFAAQHAIPNLVYCVVRFNEMVALTRTPAQLWVPRLIWIPAMIVAVRVAWRYRQTTPLRLFFAFGCAFFFVTLFGFWILISPRDFLPCLPLLVIFAVAYVDRKEKNRVMAYVLASIVFIVVIARDADRFRNHTREITTEIHQVLGVTRPGEPIMDLKGETIYRPRPYYFVFEFIARNAMVRGLLEDTIPEDVVRAQCHVAQADGEFFPTRGRAFLNSNFMDIGRLRVAGKWINVHHSFTIAIPGQYVLINRRGEVEGTLDGTAYRSPRYLAAGTHSFMSAATDTPIACFWAPAYLRGYSPFHLQDRDF